MHATGGSNLNSFSKILKKVFKPNLQSKVIYVIFKDIRQ